MELIFEGIKKAFILIFTLDPEVMVCPASHSETGPVYWGAGQGG
jgi:hypothetical protein